MELAQDYEESNPEGAAHLAGALRVVLITLAIPALLLPWFALVNLLGWPQEVGLYGPLALLVPLGFVAYRRGKA